MTDEDDFKLRGIEARLTRSRPVPRLAYRGALRRSLLQSRHARESRPQRLWLRVGACGASGAALLLVAALGVQGAGPFAV